MSVEDLDELTWYRIVVKKAPWNTVILVVVIIVGISVVALMGYFSDTAQKTEINNQTAELRKLVESNESLKIQTASILAKIEARNAEQNKVRDKFIADLEQLARDSAKNREMLADSWKLQQEADVRLVKSMTALELRIDALTKELKSVQKQLK